jgi:hypothetical protein
MERLFAGGYSIDYIAVIYLEKLLIKIDSLAAAGRSYGRRGIAGALECG